MVQKNCCARKMVISSIGHYASVFCVRKLSYDRIKLFALFSRWSRTGWLSSVKYADTHKHTHPHNWDLITEYFSIQPEYRLTMCTVLLGTYFQWSHLAAQSARAWTYRGYVPRWSHSVFKGLLLFAHPKVDSETDFISINGFISYIWPWEEIKPVIQSIEPRYFMHESNTTVVVRGKIWNLTNMSPQNKSALTYLRIHQLQSNRQLSADEAHVLSLLVPTPGIPLCSFQSGALST